MTVRGSLVLCAILLPAHAMRAQLVGSPFRVDTSTTGPQIRPAVALDGAGGAVIVWESSSLPSVQARRYDASANPIGGEFRVSTSSPTTFYDPSVSSSVSGGFVVAWTVFSASSGQDVFAQRFDSSGSKAGSEFRVNTTTTADQVRPHVAVAPSGTFLVVWEPSSAPTASFFGQFYASSGSPMGGEFRVNTFTGGRSYQSRVAAGAPGFIVVWTNTVEDNSFKGVFAQRYDTSGARVGVEFLVASATLKDQQYPSAAFDATGGFVVAWSAYQTGGVSAQIHSQRFSSSGAILGAETVVSTNSSLTQLRPHVARGGLGYLVTWADQSFVSRARFFSSNGEQSPPELVLPAQDDMAGDGAGGFMVAYSTTIDFRAAIAAQRLAAPPQPLLPELKVSSGANSYGYMVKVSQDQTGSFVVVWNSYDSGVGGVNAFDVSARRHDAAGAAIGLPFRVNTYTTDLQRRPDVAPLPGGGFVVVWDDYSSFDGSPGGIFGKRFDASGTAVTPDFRVNAATTGDQHLPSVASASSGSFVVAWIGPDAGGVGVFARRFSSTGAPLGGDLAVNTTVTGAQQNPSVASDSAGNFVVAWESAGQDGNGNGVFMRRFSSAGDPLTDELLVNNITIGDQAGARVGMNAAGEFVIAFTSTGVDGSGTAIRMQRYASTGEAVGSQVTVNTYTTGDQQAEAVSVSGSGDFIIVWHGPGDGNATGVFAQRYRKTGERVGAEFQVNTYTTGAQSYPGVSFGTNLVVAWEAFPGSSGQGIYERVFSNSCGGDLNSDGGVDVADVFFLINNLFASGPAPACNADVNGDRSVDVADIFYLINYLFAGGPPPL